MLIRSVDRSSDSKSSANFSVSLKDTLEGKYEVKHVQFPNLIYNITSYNNNFTFDDNDGTFNCQLTPGNYDETSLATEIKTQMESKSTVNYTITFNSVSGKYTYVPDVGNLQFLFSGLSNSANRAFGFTKTDTSISSSLVSSYPISLDYAPSLFIKIKEASNHTFSTASRTRGQIYLPLGDASFGSYKLLASGKFTQYLHLENTDTLNIQVCDCDENLIDFGTGEWELLIERV